MYAIYKFCRGPHNTPWRAAGWRPMLWNFEPYLPIYTVSYLIRRPFSMITGIGHLIKILPPRNDDARRSKYNTSVYSRSPVASSNLNFKNNCSECFTFSPAVQALQVWQILSVPQCVVKRVLIDLTRLVAPVSCNETENNGIEESRRKQCGSEPLVLSLSCLSVKETYTAYYDAVGRQLQFESSPDSKRLR